MIKRIMPASLVILTILLSIACQKSSPLDPESMNKLSELNSSKESQAILTWGRTLRSIGADDMDISIHNASGNFRMIFIHDNAEVSKPLVQSFLRNSTGQLYLAKGMTVKVIKLGNASAVRGQELNDWAYKVLNDSDQELFSGRLNISDQWYSQIATHDGSGQWVKSRISAVKSSTSTILSSTEHFKVKVNKPLGNSYNRLEVYSNGTLVHTGTSYSSVQNPGKHVAWYEFDYAFKSTGSKNLTFKLVSKLRKKNNNKYVDGTLISNDTYSKTMLVFGPLSITVRGLSQVVGTGLVEYRASVTGGVGTRTYRFYRKYDNLSQFELMYSGSLYKTTFKIAGNCIVRCIVTDAKGNSKTDDMRVLYYPNGTIPD